MRSFSGVLAFLLLTAITSAAEYASTKTLNIYVVDVEGGNATLVVSPSGESILIDSGNLGAAVRDAERIMAAVKDAGVRQIDKLVTTHWHLDHFGGMAALAARIPILEFIDHGVNVQPTAQTDAFLKQTYPVLYKKAKHRIVKAGEMIPVAGTDVTVVSSAGKTIAVPLPSAGTPNPHCAKFNPAPVDRSENAQSIGLHIRFGKFRAVHLGDLSTNKEFELMCPDNRIGIVDLFIVSHHGQLNSNNEILVHAIESRVAVMNNGTRKGGEPLVMKILHSAPGLEDLWQLHFSQLSGQEYTVPGMFIANLTDKPQPLVPAAPLSALNRNATTPAPVHNGPAYWIKVSAKLDGSFTVTNSRNGFSKIYRARSE